ncbi:MAG: hypothetical protein WDZ32_01775 [Candidatus Saccharimonadales bacterium]
MNNPNRLNNPAEQLESILESWTLKEAAGYITVAIVGYQPYATGNTDRELTRDTGDWATNLSRGISKALMMRMREEDIKEAVGLAAEKAREALLESGVINDNDLLHLPDLLMNNPHLVPEHTAGYFYPQE